jgi:glycosyltransferase involved in cell wall biosynthesis
LILSALPTIELCEAAVDYAGPRGIPVVLDMRDMWPDIILDLAPRWAQGAARVALSPMFRAMRDACTRAAAIVGITPEFVDWGLGYTGRPRGRWDRHFPHIFKSPSFDPTSLAQARRSWQEQGVGATGREFIACFFGTMGIQAEIPSVIDAARRLRNAGRPFQFVLCGTGDHLDRYRRMAEGLDNVIFPGWIAGCPMTALMEMASVGLHPYRSSRSYVISWPSKSIQYLASGLPVVSSLRGALENLLSEHQCGVTYQNENGEVLASVLLDLSRQPARLAAMAANARRLHASQFAADKILDAMCAHLEEIHQNSSRRLPEGRGRVAA